MALTVSVALFLTVTIIVNIEGTLSVEASPSWGDSYHVMGTLQLPYAEIEEPFEAYYDAKNKKSKVSYYGGMVDTYQRADIHKNGVSFKVAPMTTDNVTNVKTCFQVNGTANATVTIQAVLPDMKGYKMVGKETVSNVKCNKWTLKSGGATKMNVYIMWVSQNGSTPVRYEMHGYDSLLGSHYDRYYIDYRNFKKMKTFPNTTFTVPKNLTCRGFPGPGLKESQILMNPMREYMNTFDSHIDEMFEGFKLKHKPKYNSNREHAQRKHTFRQNVRFIHSKNRAGLTYRMAVNHLADRSDEEIKLMRGLRITHGGDGGIPFDKSQYSLQSTPEHLDWALYGAVTPVKDQGVCGSCWSFGTTGTIEGAFFLKHGYQVRLSQQQLIDCSWGEGNNGCDGGEDFRSYQFIKKNGGLTTEDQYGQYLAQDGYCKKNGTQPVVNIANYVNITSGDGEALRMALANNGPISIGIDASHKSLSFYANGVYYEPACGKTVDDLDHSVLAVGYGIMNGEAYWLIKNSWSTYWGNNGYVLMSQRNNNCGVTTSATYVILE